MIKSQHIIIAALLCLIAHSSQAKQPEKHYQTEWCQKNNGLIKYTLPDRSRCDCLADTHAVEIEFGRKWQEGIGQSLYYALQTGKKAGIVLISEKDSDYKYWLRRNTTIAHHHLPIDTWMVSP